MNYYCTTCGKGTLKFGELLFRIFVLCLLSSALYDLRTIISFLHIFTIPFKLEQRKMSAAVRTTLKTTVFWDVAPCNLTETDRRFRRVSITGAINDGGSKNPGNVGQFPPHYKA
jgi:hypothetical protein